MEIRDYLDRIGIHDIIEVNKNTLFKLQKNHLLNISLIGDSVGGILITSLVQRLVLRNIDLPTRIILISPVMDATMSNTQIDRIDKIDPMLSKRGVLSAKKMCAENDDLKNVMISPINGDFKGFPKVIVFVAERDITYPDQRLAIKKMIDSGVNVELIIGNGMPRIWPLLPIMNEAKLTLEDLINRV